MNTFRILSSGLMVSRGLASETFYDYFVDTALLKRSMITSLTLNLSVDLRRWLEHV